MAIEIDIDNELMLNSMRDRITADRSLTLIYFKYSAVNLIKMVLDKQKRNPPTDVFFEILAQAERQTEFNWNLIHAEINEVKNGD